MTHPSRTLKRWHPLSLAGSQPAGPTTVTFEGDPPGATLLVNLNQTMTNQRNLVTLYRAAQVNGLLDSLFETNGRLEGQRWYDRLARIVAMDTETVVDGEKMTFTWTDGAVWTDNGLRKNLIALSGGEIADIDQWTTDEIGENAVAEYVIVRILVRTEHETRARRLRTDFGVGSEFRTNPDEAGIMVTADCGLAVDALGKLIAEALFEYGWDRDDCEPAQQNVFMQAAHTAAARLLLNEHEAAAETIRHAARTHLGHLLPDDRTVQLRKIHAPGENVPDIQVVILRDDQAYGAE